MTRRDLRRLIIGAFTSVFFCALAPHWLQAQAIRGRVVVAGSDVPLVAAIVQARLTDGTVAASTLTSESGFFAITDKVADGVYTLRVLRIGFRPFDSAPITVAGATSEQVVLQWAGEGVPLTARVISTGRTCRISADSGTMVANVWDEARKALMSSMLAERGVAPTIERVNYTRTLELKDASLRQLRLQSEARQSFRAYTSWAPESLATLGYTTELRGAMVYRAPDATTLTSESFAGTHCFSLAAGRGEHEIDVGLAFEPSSSKNGRVDIRGTFWIERATSRLRRIDFSYVGLPSFTKAANAGGQVEFVPLKTGQWLLSRWRIRMPHVGVQQINGLDRDQQRLVAVDESGGIVTRVSDGNEVLLEHKLPVVTLHLAAADSMMTLAGAKVDLVGSELRATTNAQGRVVFRNLIEGTYKFRTTFPSLAMFGEQAIERTLVLNTADIIDTVSAPAPLTLLRSACGGDAQKKNWLALFGSLRDSSGYLADGSEGLVTVRSTQGYSSRAGATGTEQPRDTTLSRTYGALVDANGQYLICNAPRGPVLVRAENASGIGERVLNIPPAAKVLEASVSTRIESPGSASGAVSSAGARTAHLEIRLVDSDLHPVVKRRIEVTDVNGKHTNITTNATGRALLLDVPVGRTVIDAGDDITETPTLTPGRNAITIYIPEPVMVKSSTPAPTSTR